MNLCASLEISLTSRFSNKELRGKKIQANLKLLNIENPNTLNFAIDER